MKLRRFTPGSEIPTSSMADIAFLLIIFFMVTAVFSATKGLAFRLPEDDHDVPPTTVPAVFIQVFPGASVAVDCRPMGLDEILPYLEPKLTRNPNKPVIVYPDPDARYQDLVTVYDILTGAGRDDDSWRFTVENISIPTRREIDEYAASFGVDPIRSHCP